MPLMTLDGGRVPMMGADDFSTEADEIKRRRLMLESILSQDQTKGMTGLAGGLANFGLAYAKGDLGDRLNERERDLAGRRADFAREAIEKVPQPTPAQPEVNPSAPLAGEEGPPLPTNYAPPVEPGGGMVPQPPTYEHKNATPFLPTTPADWAKYGAKYGSVSPFIGGIAATGFKEATELPAKQEAARLIAQEKREENLRRNEDRLRDNAREDRRLDETIRSNTANEETKAQAARDKLELQRDSLSLRAQIVADRAEARATGAADKAEAAKGKLSADQKELTNHVKLYGEALRHDKIPQLDEKLGAVEKVISDYAAKKQPIPGVGVIESQLSPALIGEEAIKVRTPITQLRNLITVSEAGLSQTAAEMRNVLQGMGLGPLSPESAFLEAIPRLRETLETRKRTMGATYRPDAVEEFHKRFDAAAPPKAGAGATAEWGPVTKKTP